MDIKIYCLVDLDQEKIACSSMCKRNLITWYYENEIKPHIEEFGENFADNFMCNDFDNLKDFIKAERFDDAVVWMNEFHHNIMETVIQVNFT